MSESYSLWAIETDIPEVAEKLSFSKTDSGVVIAPDINKFRELKLRLLNGTHTFSCGLAFLAGFTTVKEAMESDVIPAYMQQLMLDEIAQAIPYSIPTADTTDFTNKVLDRFRNPEIEHKWIAITVQYSSKMKMRNVPLLLEHYKKHSSVPELMALGFAAHILFMKCKEENGSFYGTLNGVKYPVQDDKAAIYAEKWHNFTDASLVDSILCDTRLWDTDLTTLPGFAELVAAKLDALQNRDIQQVIKEVRRQKEPA